MLTEDMNLTVIDMARDLGEQELVGLVGYNHFFGHDNRIAALTVGLVVVVVHCKNCYLVAMGAKVGGLGPEGALEEVEHVSVANIRWNC